MEQDPADLPETRRWSVFVVLTPFQALVAELMVRSLREFSHSRIAFLVNGRSLLVGRDLPDRVLVRCLEEGAPIHFLNGGAKVSKAAVDGFVSEELDGEPAEFLCSNVDHPLGNRVLFTVRANPDRFSLASYPEGIANIVGTRQLMKKRCANLIKAGVGSVLGVPFALYGGDLGGGASAARHFTLLPEALLSDAPNVFRIPFAGLSNLDTSRARSFDGALLLGQPFHDGRGDRTSLRMQRALFDSVAEDQAWVRYKPHPREGTGPSILAAARGFEIVDDMRPAEELAIEWMPKTVYSYFSSALVHIKLLLEERVHCVAIQPARAMRLAGDHPRRWTELSVLFAKLGIEVRE